MEFSEYSDRRRSKLTPYTKAGIEDPGKMIAA
jgi:hypothetical protein